MEVKHILEKENGEDICVLDLNGKSNLADFMIFATGKSGMHLRRMADTVLDAVYKFDNHLPN